MSARRALRTIDKRSRQPRARGTARNRRRLAQRKAQETRRWYNANRRTRDAMPDDYEDEVTEVFADTRVCADTDLTETGGTSAVLVD